jgi:hypothetical protein
LENKPFLHVSVCRALHDDQKMDLFPYFSINMQEAQLMVDYTFIEDFGEFITNLMETNNDSEEDMIKV